MMFTPERLIGVAMLCFGRERLITVLCNSPLHPSEVAVIELMTVKEAYEGAICVQDFVQLAGLLNLRTSDVYVREQSSTTIEVWLFNRESEREPFDDDPTPVEHLVDKSKPSEV